VQASKQSFQRSGSSIEVVDRRDLSFLAFLHLGKQTVWLLLRPTFTCQSFGPVQFSNLQLRFPGKGYASKLPFAGRL